MRTPCLLFAALLAQLVQASELLTPTGVALEAATQFYPVGNLINDSGLSAAPDIDNYASVTHAAASASTAWTTDAPGGGSADYFALDPAVAPVPVIRFDFDTLHEFSDLVYWGYHFNAPNGNEARAFTLEFSTDGGTVYHNSVSVAASAIQQSDQETLAFGAVYSANSIRLSATDNWFEGFGGGDRVGLGEVKFIGTTPPNPNPIIDVAGSLDFGSHPSDPGTLSIDLPITNLGTDLPLELVASIDSPAPFSISAAPLSIPAGQSATLAVQFDATGQDGCFAANLELSTNDPLRPSVTVLLLAAVNCTPARPEIPEFSVAEGTFVDPISVAITTATPGAILVYTIDGSLPSSANGIAYTGPVTLTNTTQLRAAAIVPGQPTAVQTRSYVHLASDIQNYDSPLPIVVVENFNGGTIPNKGWSTNTQTGAGLQQVARQPAFLKLIDRDPETQRAALAAPAAQTSRIGIRVRGAFSSTWFPKPYSVETWKRDADEDRSLRLLGMPSESDWILYYLHPNYDRTLLYNTFIWEASRQTGRWAPQFRFVDVFINENGGDLSMADRRGIYALLEKPKRDANRIDFDALSDDGTTGGWLLGINRMDPIPVGGFPAESGATTPQFFHTAGPNRIQSTPPNVSGSGDDIPRQYNAFINFESPNGYRINTAQRAAIEGWFADFEDVFYDDGVWLDPDLGYRHYLDTANFADYMQLLTLARQGDGLLLSMFPWVSSGERKLRMGPMWDFNNGPYGGSATGTLYHRPDRLWYSRLFQDPGFQREYEDRWFAHRRGPLSNANMAAIIDAQAATITNELANAQAGLSSADWQNRLASMKSWLATRADWIDAQFLRPPDIAVAADTVTLSNNTGASGTLYYTLDNTDPLTPANETQLLSATQPATALVPTGDIGTDWRGGSEPFDDSAWQSGTIGVGYDYAGLVGLDVSAMLDVNPTVFARIAFQAPNQQTIDSWASLILRMKYEDGFVAYLNGTQIAAANAPAAPLWSSTATTGRSDSLAVVFEQFDISQHRGLLQPGPNTLALHGLNSGPSSSDLLLFPQIAAIESATPDGGAIAYSGPIVLAESARIRTRLRTDTGQWSAINETTVVIGIPASSNNLVVSEIHYNPDDPQPSTEFIEHLNISPTDTIDLTSVRFTAGIDFDFPPGTTLVPGARILVVQDLIAFEALHGPGLPIAGTFANSTRLANNGERLSLSAADGAPIFDFEYDDDHPWPELADGAGCSLVLITPTSNPDPGDPSNWRCSAFLGGNPNTTDAVPFSGSANDLPAYALGGDGPRLDGPTFVYEVNLDAEDATIAMEISDDLESWHPRSGAPTTSVLNADGTATLRFDLPQQRSFVRLRINGR